MSQPTKRSIKKLRELKSWRGYDFIDLGAGDGASLANNEKKIGGRGIGIELDKIKVKKAQKLNRNVVHGNALDISRITGKVDFVTCDNFLEHLLSFDDVEKMIRQAALVARKFIYIRHPSFEDNEYLAGHKLKTYWSHWSGHTSMLKVADIVDMLRRQGIFTYMVVPVALMKDSDDDRILPIGAPIDQHDYEPEKHGPKPTPTITFDREVYYAFDIIGIMPVYSGLLPELIYDDRLAVASRPKFLFPNPEDGRVKNLENQLAVLRNRKSVRFADWAGGKLNPAKSIVNRLKQVVLAEPKI